MGHVSHLSNHQFAAGFIFQIVQQISVKFGTRNVALEVVHFRMYQPLL
jgi:hypothetical protein